MISVIEFTNKLRMNYAFEIVFCNSRLPSLNQDQILENKIKNKEPLQASTKISSGARASYRGVFCKRSVSQDSSALK